MIAIPTLLIALAVGASPEPRTDAAPTPVQVRQSVERSLVFLEKSGADWWKSSKCASCHHVPMSVWSLTEAKNRGFAINDKSLGELENSALSSYADHPKLKPVGQDGGEGLSMNTIYLTVAATSAAQLDEKTAEALKKFTVHLLAAQDADGSWKSSEKLPPVFDVTEVRTMQVLLALSAAHTRGLIETASWNPARDKALAWLSKNKFLDQNQSLNLQVLVARQFGKPEEVQPLVKRLLEQQDADGGWGQTKDGPSGPIKEYDGKTAAATVQPEKRASDALATGQTLYALAIAGADPQQPAIQRAQAFLIRTQTADGSWKVPFRAQKNSGRALSHYGTGWAAIGLMQTLPAAASEQAGKN